MRLSKEYKNAITSSFEEVFENGKISLFGSRVDDNKLGGDIDLFIELPQKLSSELKFKKRLQFASKIKMKIGEQKIDVVFGEDENRIIEKEAREWGIELMSIN